MPLVRLAAAAAAETAMLAVRVVVDASEFHSLNSRHRSRTHHSHHRHMHRQFFHMCYRRVLPVAAVAATVGVAVGKEAASAVEGVQLASAVTVALLVAWAMLEVS